MPKTKKSFSLSHVILLAGAFCAYLIGSGFATGQEIMQFFTSGGIKGYISIIIFIVLMGTSTFILCSVGYRKKFKNPYDVFEYYCGKILGQIYVWFSLILNYGIYVVMLAGGGATIHQYYGIPTFAGTAIIAVIALGTALLGMEKLIKIIGVIGPVKILFIAILGVASIVTLFGNPSLLTEANKILPTLNVTAASSNWAWSGALYAFACVTMCIPFLVNLGASSRSLKEAKSVAVVGVLGYALAIFMLLTAELVNIKLVAGSQVPTLVLAANISPILAAVFSLLIIVAIYSAVSSLLLMTVRKFAEDKTRKFNILAFVLTAIGTTFGGILPFDKLVNVLYSLVGYAAIVFTVLMLYKEIKILITKKDSSDELNVKKSEAV